MSLISSFTLLEVLSNDPHAKRAVLLGSIENQPALCILEKTGIPDPEQFSVADMVQEGRQTESNDVYTWFVANFRQDLDTRPGLKVNFVYPASETHINKHRRQSLVMIRETPEKYRQLVVPYIQTMKGDRIKWVHNILHEGKEAEDVLFRDDDPKSGFVLLPDMKWDRVNLDTLYLVAIMMDGNLSSIRDLTAEHIPILEVVRDAIFKVVESKFGLERTSLKLYFHYQPSYYHMHIHVASVALQQNDFGRSVLLDNVIDHLQFADMADATLSYTLGKGHQLYVNGLR